MAVAQAPRAAPFLREAQLFFGNVVGPHAHPVMLGHVQRQSTPAATGFHHLLARFEPQFPADEMHLGNLRLLKGG